MVSRSTWKGSGGASRHTKLLIRTICTTRRGRVLSGAATASGRPGARERPARSATGLLRCASRRRGQPLAGIAAGHAEPLRHLYLLRVRDGRVAPGRRSGPEAIDVIVKLNTNWGPANQFVQWEPGARRPGGAVITEELSRRRDLAAGSQLDRQVTCARPDVTSISIRCDRSDAAKGLRNEAFQRAVLKDRRLGTQAHFDGVLDRRRGSTWSRTAASAWPRSGRALPV
jgi:hypothetical protein